VDICGYVDMWIYIVWLGPYNNIYIFCFRYGNVAFKITRNRMYGICVLYICISVAILKSTLFLKFAEIFVLRRDSDCTFAKTASVNRYIILSYIILHVFGLHNNLIFLILFTIQMLDE